MREPVGLASETDHLQDIRNRLLDEPPRLADHLEGEGHVVEDVLLRQEPEVLEHDPEVAPEIGHLATRQLPEVLPEHMDLPL